MDEVVQLQVRGVVVGLFRTNCYVVGSRRGGEAVCIDPGDEPEQILALARDLGVRITRLVATHAQLVPQHAAMWLGAPAPPPPPVDHALADGLDLEIEGVSLRVLHTPGHTPG